MSLIIEIKTIPHEEQRYDTLGDYVGHEKLRFISVTDMKNARVEFLVALHELVEQALCLARGIPEESITRFDMASASEEPGDDPAAPYHREHVFAEAVVRMTAAELGHLEEYDLFFLKRTAHA